MLDEEDDDGDDVLLQAGVSELLRAEQGEQAIRFVWIDDGAKCPTPDSPTFCFLGGGNVHV